MCGPFAREPGLSKLWSVNGSAVAFSVGPVLKDRRKEHGDGAEDHQGGAADPD